MDDLIAGLQAPPRLLLHCCCAPCASYVLEYLTQYFRITVFFCNSNMDSDAEYRHRAAELRRLIDESEYRYAVEYVDAGYDPELFEHAAAGLERCAEGGERCRACFLLRLRATAARAAAQDFDWFATTLTVSPHKNAAAVNAAGLAAAAEYGCRYLESDFKKCGGFQRSLQLSAKHSLYRQNYCGCRFSRRAAATNTNGETDI